MKNSFTETKKSKTRSAFARATEKGPGTPFDWWLFTIMLTILAIGLVMVLSASGIVAEQVNGDKYYFFKRQLLFAAGGGVALWGAALLPREWLYKLQYPALFFSLLLLLITLSPFAPAINGAKRWIPLGPVSVQPMEFVKIALALYLAYFMSSKQELIKTFSRGVIPPFAVTGLFCFLLLLQPDFGSAVVLAGILFFMCVAGGTRFIYLFFSLALACAGAMALAIASPYRLRRLLAFLDPFQDAHNTGYQLVQSLLAIGSGGVTGLGLGNSKQKFLYLPEAQNDFIFAVVCEELGLIGACLILALFALLIIRGYWLALHARDRFGSLVIVGVTTLFAFQVFANVAVVTNLFPVTGISLPFFSSEMWLILSISRQNPVT